MVSLLMSELLPYLIGAVVALGALWGYGKKREGDGVAKEKKAARLRDLKSATATKERVEDALDDARDVSAIEQLRKSGRLRD